VTVCFLIIQRAPRPLAHQKRSWRALPRWQTQRPQAGRKAAPQDSQTWQRACPLLIRSLAAAMYVGLTARPPGQRVPNRARGGRCGSPFSGDGGLVSAVRCLPGRRTSGTGFPTRGPCLR
jgi:hypothetical protein